MNEIFNTAWEAAQSLIKVIAITPLSYTKEAIINKSLELANKLDISPASLQSRATEILEAMYCDPYDIEELVQRAGLTLPINNPKAIENSTNALSYTPNLDEPNWLAAVTSIALTINLVIDITSAKKIAKEKNLVEQTLSSVDLNDSPSLKMRSSKVSGIVKSGPLHQ